MIASLEADDISWTSKINIPNLTIIRYISDSGTAEYHPPIPRKGREALIYHTYLHDFYDDLPDISIMIHADENPWHIDAELQQSMSFALSQLDLAEVEKRRYVNLHVNWNDGCPDWINTTRSVEDSHTREEPFMRTAYQENFHVPKSDVPEILGAPCCSQFAVTREAVRRNEREQYQRHMEWLIFTKWSDYIAGRTWEHLWQSLFLGESVDCPSEFLTYCRLYRESPCNFLRKNTVESQGILRTTLDVCFSGPQAVEDINRLWKERHALMEATELWIELLNPHAGIHARKRIKAIENFVETEIEGAILRGRNYTYS